tara:strand:+ start:564 stop:971 length:408 start_codon:yes stop_codon:yes gene_type:complete
MKSVYLSQEIFFKIPDVQPIQTISIPLPTADIPSYVPLVVPPSDLREPEGTQPATTETTEQSAPSINIPFINIDVPLPTTEVIVAASYAAVSAVAVTTLAQPFFDTIKKKLQKFIQGKIDKWKKKKSSKDNQKVS